MKVLILPDIPGWAVDRCCDSLIGNMPGVQFVKRFYACTETAELVRLAADVDLIYYANWDISGHWPFINETGTPVLLGIRSHRYPAYVKKAAKQCAAVHVLNAGLETEFPGSYRIPDGVDDRFFREPVVGFAGKPDAYKGFPLIMEACRRLGLELRTATGDVPPEEMPAFYRSIDVLVCASEAEGTGLPVLEALAMGKRVVSTGVGQAWWSEGTDRVGDVCWTTGWSLADIMDALVRSMDREYRRTERYRWSTIAPEYEALFTKVAAMKAVLA